MHSLYFTNVLSELCESLQILSLVDLWPVLLYCHYLPKPAWQMTTSTGHSKSQDMPVCTPHSSGLLGKPQSAWSPSSHSGLILPSIRRFYFPGISLVHQSTASIPSVLFTWGSLSSCPSTSPARLPHVYRTRVSVRRFSAARPALRPLLPGRESVPCPSFHSSPTCLQFGRNFPPAEWGRAGEGPCASGRPQRARGAGCCVGLRAGWACERAGGVAGRPAL